MATTRHTTAPFTNAKARGEECALYEVQTYTLADGWINCWQDEDGKPVLFPTFADAEEGLADYRKDCEEAVARGRAIA